MIMAQPKTLRIVATDPATQGAFVVIDADQYAPELHTLAVEQLPQAPDAAPAAKAANPKTASRGKT
jgi:hypothetical protein